MGVGSVGGFTAHTSTLTGARLATAVGSRMVGVLAGELRDATGEPWISGDTAGTAVILLPTVGKPCVLGAAGSECELSGRGNALVGTASS